MNSLHRSINLQSYQNSVSEIKSLLPLVVILLFALCACGSGAGNGSRTNPPPGQHTVTLSWFPNYPPVAGYNVYRGTVQGGPYPTQLNSSLQTTTNFSDSTVQNGTTYYYVVTAVNAQSEESSYSSEVAVAVPSS